MFEIGQQVVCIDDTWINPKNSNFNIRPVLNSVYTIRDVYTFWDDVAFSILLEEIVNKLQSGKRLRKLGIDAPPKVEPSFLWYHFRPVKKTNISTFTNLLNDVPNKSSTTKPKDKIVRKPELV